MSVCESEDSPMCDFCCIFASIKKKILQIAVRNAGCTKEDDYEQRIESYHGVALSHQTLSGYGKRHYVSKS